jgi:hypothetical protein
MLTIDEYERLEAAAVVVAHHARFDGRPHVVQSCVREVEERFESGSLSPGQRSRLIAILLGEAILD